VARKTRTSNRVNQRRVKLLTAAATRIDLESKEDAQLQRKVRQNWQIQAWTYYDSIPELGFAVEFMAHNAASMRIFTAVLPTVGETGTPIDIHTPELQVPEAIVNACDNALRDLGNGRLELSKMMENLSIQITIAGEGFILGVTDPITGKTTYSVRSISEIVVNDDEIQLREGPMTNQGILGLVDLPPDSMVTRVWNPHPQYRILAQSRMRALLNTCEDIMILRRMIRATARNRLAGRGLLIVPSEADLPIFNDDDMSVGGATWYDELTNSMITPIRNEGDASAVVPMVTEMDGDSIKNVRWIEFTSTFDERAPAVRSELLDTLATGLDLPKEAITGMADLNHWTAWAIDANTFRYHVEPHVKKLVDLLTTGYLRNYLLTCTDENGMPLAPGLVNAWVDRILFWYDPTELITPPDQTATALELHDRGVLSNAALLRTAGFAPEDAPSPAEFAAWLISKQRTWPANLSLAVLHQIYPELAVPPILTTGTVPGIKPGTGAGSGVDVGPDPVAIAEGDVGAEPTPVSPTGATEIPPTPKPPVQGPPPAGPPSGLTSAGAVDRRFSWTMAAADRELRKSLQVAANDEMRRQLEKLGNRLRSKVAKNSSLRTKIALTHDEHVAMVLGHEVVASSGLTVPRALTAAGMLRTDWSNLEETYKRWVSAAQASALKRATKFGHLNEKQVKKIKAHNADNLTKGWETLKNSMDAIGAAYVSNPNPNISDDEAIANLNPDSLVPTGIIRTALAVAGGAALSAFAMQAFKGDTGPAVPTVPDGSVSGGIATGQTITDALADAGTTTDNYEWVHGPSNVPCPAHEDLDGQEFASFTDDALANNGEWPDVPFYYPGDHDGCLCDAMPLWVSQSDVDEAEAALV
jgi:hypothetical protein